MPTPGTLEYPTALDTVVSLFEVNNRAYTTLSADINNSALAIPLTDSTSLPTTGVVTLTDSLTAPTKHEEIIFTANAANSLTVPIGGRGAFGSTAQNWSGTVYVRMRMIAEHHEVVRDAVIQLETKVGYGSATPTVGKFLVGDTTAGTSTWRVLAAADMPSEIDATKIADGSVSNTEFQYLNGVTSAIQTQIDGKASATAPGSSGQLLYNNANAYAAVAGSTYSASANQTLTFTPASGKTGLLIYQPGSGSPPATILTNPLLLHLHVTDNTQPGIGYSSDATAYDWLNFIENDGSLVFATGNGTDYTQYSLYPKGLQFFNVSATYYGGFAEVASDQFGLMLTTGTPASGAIFPLTWRATGITQAAPATALADGSVPVNHVHFYQDEATNELKAKWKESGGSVNTITFGSGGASNPFDDATAIIKGSGDATKLLRIEVDGLTTATTRVWTAPDANLTVAGIDLAQTWTANQTFGSGILRATSPQITTGINDSNGASLIAVTATGSAIFGLTLANAASGGTVAVGVTTPTQGASAIAGTPLSITASAAVAGNVNVGAAAGGSITLTAGNAARLTSGNANGGDINLLTGAGIGTGTQGKVIVGAASTTYLQVGGTGGPILRHITNLGVRNSTDGGFTGVEAGTFFAKNGTTTHAQLAPSDTSSVAVRDTAQIVFSSTNNAFGTPDVIMMREAAANLRFGAAAAASPVAQTLSVQNGTGTNIAGATWTLRASLGTGNAVPGRLHLAAGAMSATSGTTQQTTVDRGVIGATKVLTNNSAITITNVTVASNSVAGGQIGYLIEVTDGTDFQYETGVVSFGVTNKGGVFSGNTCTKFGNHQDATSGTLTVTFAISGANPALLSCNANSSLTPSTGFPRITYWLMNESQQAIAIQ